MSVILIHLRENNQLFLPDKFGRISFVGNPQSKILLFQFMPCKHSLKKNKTTRFVNDKKI